MKFRVTGEDDSRPYRIARVEAMPETVAESEKAALRTQRERLEDLVTRGGRSKVPPEMPDEELVNMVAQHLPVSLAERQNLLELEGVLVRAQALIHLIESKGLANPR